MRLTFVGLLVVLTVGLGGCSDSDSPVTPPTPTNFKSLEQKDDVLHNLLFAYNERNYGEVERMLDDNFIFYFSAVDVANGVVRSGSWTKSDEIIATTNMLQPPIGITRWSDAERVGIKQSSWGVIKTLFDDNTGSPPADDMYLELFYTKGEEAWDPVTPPDPESYPDEIWYEKAAAYFLAVRVGDTTYTQNKSINARFTIRSVKVGGKDIWQIITWHDDVPDDPLPE